MVLVDAHSDASAAERSEEMREAMRRVVSEEQREEVFEGWRVEGRLQAFDWVEPMMPRPLGKVVWLAAPRVSKEQRGVLSKEVGQQLDGRMEFEPRSAGSFAGRWEVLDLEGLSRWDAGGDKVILAIDLDWFAGMPEKEGEGLFERIWGEAMDWPGLEGVALAVSRPWLESDEEADRLVRMALAAVRNTRGALLEVDASLDDRPDFSRRARKEGGAVRRWDLGEATVGLKQELFLFGERVVIRDRVRPWGEFLEGNVWDEVRIGSREGYEGVDGVWRYRVGDEPVLFVGGLGGATGKVRWFLHTSARESYDLIPETGLGKGFTDGPGRWVYEERVLLAETEDFQLEPGVWCGEGGGRYRISAECETTDGWLATPVIELRVRTGEGFLGALSELQEMPYVFGVYDVKSEGLSGVETGWGSDCANFLIYGWRRSGRRIPWGDPKSLDRFLRTVASEVRVEDGMRLPAGGVAEGVVICFGAHVAAVWEDLPPLGILDGGDLAIHHLGGRPEVLRMDELVQGRPAFEVKTLAEVGECVVKVGGDVVLSDTERTVVDGFGRGEADLFFVNLEGIPTVARREEVAGYDFRFPAGRLEWLKERGVDAVSLANNHSMDGGREGLLKGMDLLAGAGIGSFGAGKDERHACRPLCIERGGVPMAVFGVSYFQEGLAGEGRAGVAGLPAHAGRLEREFRAARERAEVIIVMVHGGDEYEREVTAEQRRWARWLVARGADFVVGAHSHVVQPMEFHAGAEVHHSLGNAVYPKSLGGLGSGVVRVLEVGGR